METNSRSNELNAMVISREIVEEKKYTEKQIKEAYWETFHKTGELWFNYLGTDGENEESTRAEYEYFLENLKTSNK